MGYVFYAFMLGLAALFLAFDRAAAAGAAEGLRLFADNVLPSLFPFMVCGQYLAMGPPVRKGRRAPAGGLPAPAAILVRAAVCALCGTPSAALVCGGLYRAGADRRRASMLCAALNQTNPYFIICLLANGLLRAPGLWGAIALAHYVPSFTAAVLLGLRALPEPPVPKGRAEPAPLLRFGRALSEATFAVLRVGGTLIFFRVAYAAASAAGAMRLLSPACGAFAAGLFEMTNGLALLTSAGLGGRLCFALCCFLLSFGGVCIFIQSKQFFEELCAAPYFAAKLIIAAASFGAGYAIYPHFGGAASVMAGLGDSAALIKRADTAAAFMLCVLFSLAASYIYARTAVGRRVIG